MKELFLKTDAPWDVPTFETEKQTIVDESQINQSFVPANDFFSELREAGDWVFDFVSGSITQITEHFM